MNRRCKVMFLTAALVLQFAVFCGVQSQMDPNAKIQGRVVDAKTKDPLMGVGVSIVGQIQMEISRSLNSRLGLTPCDSDLQAIKRR
jgi:hypothetical protein